MSTLSFLWRGITLASFSKSGNSPASKQRLIKFDNQKEKKALKALIMNTGIPFGPVDFLGSSLSINLLISSGLVGERKKVAPFGLISNLPFDDFLYRYELKLPSTSGIFCCTLRQELRSDHWKSSQ